LAIFCIFNLKNIWLQHIQSSCYEKNKNEKGTFLSYIPCSFGGGITKFEGKCFLGKKFITFALGF
jgi:hypothetical protein